MQEGFCKNGHIIGGQNHILTKKDIRVFYTKDDDENLNKKWKRYSAWLNSYVHTTLDEFKLNYVDKNILKQPKGINISIELNDFEKKNSVREMNVISFRILNFVLYSFLLGSYILGNFSDKESKSYLFEGVYSLFDLIKLNWLLLGEELKEIEIENVQVFMNMIFDKIINIIINLKSVDNLDQLYSFEKEVDKYINSIISKKEEKEKINQDYQKLKKNILNNNPNNIKEIILEHFPPSLYDHNSYPDFQYYILSKGQNFDNFVRKFQSSKENENKYALINMLVKKNEDLTQNVIKMENLENINKLENILINIYSLKITREEGKEKIFENELEYIIKQYSEINNSVKINKEQFIEKYINPFLESWNKIKKNVYNINVKH